MSSGSLFMAITQKNWCSAIRLIHESHHNRAALDTDNNGNTILHLACQSHESAPLTLVRSLIDNYYDLLLYQNKDGETPLLTAVFNNSENASKKIIPLLIDACPAAVSIPNYSDKRIPLHYAVAFNRSAKIIRALLNADPRTGSIKDKYGDTPLRIFLKKWIRELTAFFEHHSYSIISPSPFSELYFCNKRGEITNITNVSKRTILFLKAALSGYSLDMHLDDNDDNDTTLRSFSPVHASLKSNTVPWAYCHMLLRIHPDEAKRRDNEGNLPIHLAMTKSPSDGELYQCLQCETQFLATSWYQHVDTDKKYCQACYQKNGFGPRHYQRMYPELNIPALMNCLLTLNPRGASTHNRDGRLPINLAIESGKNFYRGGIQALIGAAPETLNTRDVKTHMLPFMIAAAMKWPDDDEGLKFKSGAQMYPYYDPFEEQLTTVYLLIKADPSVISRGVLEEKQSMLNRVITL